MGTSDQTPVAIGRMNVTGEQIKDVSGFRSVCNVSESGCKKLRIQTGVVTRLCKEYNFYLTECEGLLRQIERMKQDGVCLHDIKQRSEVFAETRVVLPEVLSHLRSGRDKLANILNECVNDKEYDEIIFAPFITAANESISSACEILQDTCVDVTTVNLKDHCSDSNSDVAISDISSDY